MNSQESDVDPPGIEVGEGKKPTRIRRFLNRVLPKKYLTKEVFISWQVSSFATDAKWGMFLAPMFWDDVVAWCRNVVVVTKEVFDLWF